jgi:Spy/CpxP family protein refolding chaperone
MRRHIPLAALLCITAASAVYAQPPGPRGGPMDIDRLTVLLDLDAYQQEQVKQILDAQREEMRKNRGELEGSGERPSFDEMRARREQHREELLAKLGGVLNEQQMTKFKVLTEPPQGGPRRGRPQGEQ